MMVNPVPPVNTGNRRGVVRADAPADVVLDVLVLHAFTGMEAVDAGQEQAAAVARGRTAARVAALVQVRRFQRDGNAHSIPEPAICLLQCSAAGVDGYGRAQAEGTSAIMQAHIKRLAIPRVLVIAELLLDGLLIIRAQSFPQVDPQRSLTFADDQLVPLGVEGESGLDVHPGFLPVGLASR